MTPDRELIREARECADRESVRNLYVGKIISRLADALEAVENKWVGHDIELVGEGELAYCRRCRGGEVELDEPCASRLARQLAEARGVSLSPPAAPREPSPDGPWIIEGDYDGCPRVVSNPFVINSRFAVPTPAEATAVRDALNRVYSGAHPTRAPEGT